MIPEEIKQTAIACAKGDYQYNLLRGIERWSGSSLKGKAREYGARYNESRINLVRRIQGAVSERGWHAQCQTVLRDEKPRRGSLSWC